MHTLGVEGNYLQSKSEVYREIATLPENTIAFLKAYLFNHRFSVLTCSAQTVNRFFFFLCVKGSIDLNVPLRNNARRRVRACVYTALERKTAPRLIRRGSAATDGLFAYFTSRDFNSVYQYECSTEKWEQLPSCPYKNSGLVIIDRELTAVGGWDGSRRTNKLYTLRQRKWVEKYPPMNTARSYTAVVTTSDGEYIIPHCDWGR